MYKLQTNFFGGDATFVTDFKDFNSLDEVIKYIMDNEPPSEYEWNVRKDGKGGSVVWTQWGGQRVSAYLEGKVVTLRERQS